MFITGGKKTLEDASWLVPNVGPRCTIVSAASALQLLGAKSETLVSSIEKQLFWFNENRGPSWVQGPSPFDYVGLGRPSRLDKAIEKAAKEGGIRVRSRTIMPPFWSWKLVTRTLENGGTVVLNCVKAPSGSRSHSVICIGHDQGPDRLLTIDPNDFGARWKFRCDRKSGIVFCVTLIERLAD